MAGWHEGAEGTGIGALARLRAFIAAWWRRHVRG
jgi:hypothetical protein